MKKFRSKPALALALLAAAGLALSGCADAAGGDTASDVEPIGTISLGVVPDATTAPLVVAAEQGLFEKYGLTPEVKIFSSGGAANQSVAAGDIDVTASGQYAVVVGAAAGTNVDILARMSVADEQVGIVANESITSIEDLEGKTVGVQEGSTAALYAILLQQASDVSFTLENVGNDQIIAAFANGQVDAIVTWQPNVDRAVEAVDGSSILAFSGDDDIMPLVTYLVSSTKFAENTAAVEAAVKAISEASEWSAENPDELTQLLAQQFSVDEGAVRGSVDVFAFDFGWDDAAEKTLADAAGVVEAQQGTTVDLDQILKISVSSR
ncbi:ABC transporter substrate-binding protein [Agromyces silvae]|uniref:ABC transporter substrate-binding protein n=1 Tax=Agromyces silvae TaxID=3388266 RepID=UPI00280A9AE9|nr:ABC transporter substrate-binding protein [Agromyces protaetiae]